MTISAETDQQITNLMDQYGIENQTDCRRYVHGFLGETPDGSIDLEATISDVASLQKKVDKSEKRDLPFFKTRAQIYQETGIFHEPLKRRVVTGMGTEYDTDDAMTFDNEKAPMNDRQISEASIRWLGPDKD